MLCVYIRQSDILSFCVIVSEFYLRVGLAFEAEFSGWPDLNLRPILEMPRFGGWLGLCRIFFAGAHLCRDFVPIRLCGPILALFADFSLFA
jgi:hypothetical protein